MISLQYLRFQFDVLKLNFTVDYLFPVSIYYFTLGENLLKSINEYFILKTVLFTFIII